VKAAVTVIAAVTAAFAVFGERRDTATPGRIFVANRCLVGTRLAK
jgi:hypothetical protein